MNLHLYVGFPQDPLASQPWGAVHASGPELSRGYTEDLLGLLQTQGLHEAMVSQGSESLAPPPPPQRGGGERTGSIKDKWQHDAISWGVSSGSLAQST